MQWFFNHQIMHGCMVRPIHIVHHVHRDRRRCSAAVRGMWTNWSLVNVYSCNLFFLPFGWFYDLNTSILKTWPPTHSVWDLTMSHRVCMLRILSGGCKIHPSSIVLPRSKMQLRRFIHHLLNHFFWMFWIHYNVSSEGSLLCNSWNRPFHDPKLW